MPELGKYAFVVMGSYAISLLLLAGLVGLTFWRGAQAKAALRRIEDRQGNATDG